MRKAGNLIEGTGLGCLKLTTKWHQLNKPNLGSCAARMPECALTWNFDFNPGTPLCCIRVVEFWPESCTKLP